VTITAFRPHNMLVLQGPDIAIIHDLGGGCGTQPFTYSRLAKPRASFGTEWVKVQEIRGEDMDIPVEFRK
jgi:hypothetical protein